MHIFMCLIYIYFDIFNWLVGDNIDHEMCARIQTKDLRNRSIHWTHQFAVLDRVQDPTLKDSGSKKLASEIQFCELLPDKDVQVIYFKTEQ